MAWRKTFFLVTLATLLSACSFPVQISFSSRSTPVSESKSLTPSATEPSGGTNQQVSGSENPDQQTRYIVQVGTPVGVVNFVDPVAGCNWTGVGGQVFGLDAQPVTNLVATLGGNFNGKQLSQLSMTGGAQVLGPGGYLIGLGDHPVETHGTLWLQLFDQEGNAVSDKVFFDTYSGCDRNLILINFSERFTIQTTNFLPFIGNERLYYFFPFVGQK